MSQQQRAGIFERQLRAYTEGTVESINGQWIFFDSETDEASSLEEYVHQEVQLKRGRTWQTGVLDESCALVFQNGTLHLRDGETIKIRKQIIYSFENLLGELEDDSFFQFTNTLNSLDFSIYDCLYCYNQLDFLKGADIKTGANFLVFDNESHVCSVQHHFFHSQTRHERFEFTLNTGKRIMIEKMNSTDGK